MSNFPFKKKGRILCFVNEMELPNKIIEMGLLPNVSFQILFQAPFQGPLYVEFGEEKTKIALRKEEAEFIVVENTP